MMTLNDALRGEYLALRNGAAFLDRSRGAIEVSGSEAVVFLHNLCTNDIKSLPPDRGCETFWCTATAKVIAHGFIWRLADSGKNQNLLIDIDSSHTSALLAHLDHYLISEDVTLTDRTAEIASLHLAGPEASVTMSAVGLPCGEWKPLTTRVINGVTIHYQAALGVPGYDLQFPQTELPEWQARFLAAGAAAISKASADIVRIETVTPQFGVDVDENTFAPEVNRTPQAISYNKGCYIGQEPIVMARDRGVIQRLLVGLSFPEANVPPGSILSRDGKEVGRVTSSVLSPQYGAIGLGYVRRGSQSPGTELQAEIPSGKVLVQVRLPLL